MAHPYKSHAHKSDPNWVEGVRKFADGGKVGDGDDHRVNTWSDALFKDRSRAENRFIEATRKYPFRLGTGPASSEKHLAGERAINMNEARRISDAVPRKRGGKV